MDETVEPSWTEPSAGGQPGEGTTPPLARPISGPVALPPPTPRDELSLPDSNAAAAWLDLALMVCLLGLFEVTAATLFAAFAGGPPAAGSAAFDRDHSMDLRRLLLPSLAVRAVISMVVVACIVRSRRQTAASLGVTADRLGRNLLVGLGALVVAYVLIYAIMLPLAFAWPGAIDQMQENVWRIRRVMPDLNPAGFLAVAATVGVYEELLFRGFLMTRLRRGLGSWTGSVMISTAVFTSLHGMDQTPAALVLITVLSLVFSAVTIWRRSIVPAIVAHALWDFSQFVYLYYVAGDQWT